MGGKTQAIDPVLTNVPFILQLQNKRKRYADRDNQQKVAQERGCEFIPVKQGICCKSWKEIYYRNKFKSSSSASCQCGQTATTNESTVES